MNVFSLAYRSKNMSAFRSTSTKGEVRLAKALCSLSYRYCKNSRTVFGTPGLNFKN
jgi:DNA mismatch endonuclease (patch repair protein)